MAKKKQIDPIDDELEKKRREFQDEIAHDKSVKSDKPRDRKRFAFGITLLAVLLIGLGAAAAYALWFNPERAVSDAIVRALSSQTITFNGTAQSGKTLDVQFNGAVAGSNGAKLTFNARIEANNTTERLASDAVLDKDGNVFMSAGGIKNALGDDLVNDAGNQGSYANLLLQKLEGKWLKITSEELQPYNKKYANIQSCIQSVIRKNQGAGPVFTETAELYQKDRFIVVDEILGVRGTSTGYSVHFDKERLRTFMGNFKTTVLYKQFYDCDSGAFDINPDTIARRFGNQKLELWINQAHEITEMKTKVALGGLTTEISVTPLFNQEVRIITPTTTVNLAKLHEYLNDGTEALSLAKKPDNTSKQLLDALKAKLEASQ